MKCPTCTDVSLVMTERQSVKRLITARPAGASGWTGASLTNSSSALQRPSQQPGLSPLPGQTLKTRTAMQAAGVTAANTQDARSRG